MSFVRKRTPSVTSTGNRQVGGNSALKKKSLTKPVWDVSHKIQTFFLTEIQNIRDFNFHRPLTVISAN